MTATAEVTEVARVETPTLFAIPYRWDQGNPIKNTVILDSVAKHPHWFSAPSTAEERRATAAWLLTSPDHLTWEVWRGGDFCGILLLWRISPKVDALLHFAFFDRNLVGKRTLMLEFLGFCFQQLGFRRISMEIPECAETLISFARRKLGFHYEGERAAAAHPATDLLHQPGPWGRIHLPHLWVARQGSRRERAHWFNGTWHDVICLRLTAEEFAAFTQERSCPQPSPSLSASNSAAPSSAKSPGPSNPKPSRLSPKTSRGSDKTNSASSSISSAKAPLPAV